MSAKANKDIIAEMTAEGPSHYFWYVGQVVMAERDRVDQLKFNREQVLLNRLLSWMTGLMLVLVLIQVGFLVYDHFFVCR